MSSSPITTVRTVVLFVAMVLAGTLAGFFLTYGFTIMPGLATTDDRSFVEAFRGLERMFGTFENGVNWPVLLGYFGVPLAILAAIGLDRSAPGVWWLVAALVLSVGTVVFTQTFNVPLNEDLKAAVDANTVDAAQVRAEFRESWWRAWNHARSATSLGAFVCLGWALLLHGRSQSR